MRLFIAIKLNNELRSSVCDVQRQLADSDVRGNFTSAENLHITLAFIGEYGDPERVLEVMHTVRFEHFTLSLEGIGSFGDLWWIGVSRSEELTSYVKRLRRALADAGIPFDRKRFSAHITAVRRADMDYIPAVTVPNTAMTARRVSLIRSDRGKSGMIYTELGYID